MKVKSVRRVLKKRSDQLLQQSQVKKIISRSCLHSRDACVIKHFKESKALPLTLATTCLLSSNETQVQK